jgi:glycosyltransferase involved in cell wall biosynthesis
MKVAIFGIKNIPGRFGGYETCVDETSRLLVKMGHDVLVLCRKNFAESLIEDYEGVKIKYVPGVNSKNFSNLFSAFFSTMYLLFSDVKVIHVYITGNAIFIPLLKIAGKRVTLSVDGLEWKRKKWSKLALMYLKFSEKLAVRFADSIISDSHSINNYYIKKYNRQVDYVPYGAKFVPLRGSANLDRLSLIPKKYFLFVAIFRPEKNVDLLIKAFNAASTKDYKLALIGDEPNNPDYMKYVYSLGSEKIIFLGRIYGELYEEISQNAYCYVTASELEGTSPALVEAMGFGTAVLVSDIDENKETIGDAGFTFKTNDIDDLQNKIEYLIGNEDLVKQYSAKALERAKKYYTWEKVTQELEKIYTRLYKNNLNG